MTRIQTTHVGAPPWTATLDETAPNFDARGRIHPQIVWAKLATMAEGARRASARLG